MSRMAECGNLSPANGRQPYCPVCHVLEQIPELPDPGYRQAVDAVFDKLDRIHKIRTAYGRRRR